jgi:ADP-ribosyl-[dinitrogen reductase] hydrolase
VVLALVLNDVPLAESIAKAKDELRKHAHHEETLNAIEAAEDRARSTPGSPAAIRKLGEGWIAEEALAISLYCALGTADFESGVVLAVNHDGDSDSTGAITGNLLGGLYGAGRIPARWLASLELREVIEEVADDLAAFPGCTDVELYWDRYPGS